MAEDSEKRFHAIMDKLFHPPPSPPKPNSKPSPNPSTSSQQSRGMKRQSMESPQLKLRGPVNEDLRNSSGGYVQAPLCRPWDREDLYKRLATFKSMTWFAKPEVVNALNCARRGWVNVDADTIACESCGSRLLFSTPSSWAQHQVEKAALVFSLKLNNGHKVHCPWADNECDEILTQFPPASVVDLVDNYKKRLARLTQLLALPLISSAAIDYIRNPQLEHFMDVSSTMELGNKSTDASVTEHIGDECEAIFSVLYYQAQKLISLCGWEPRLLPYIVDCKDREDESTRHGNLSAPLPAVPSGKAPGISVYSFSDHTDKNEGETTSDMQCYPNSVVLDCKLCGASVGLWAFCTVPRPVEFIRLIECSETNGEGSASQAGDIFHSGAQPSRTNTSSNENLVGRIEHSSTAPTGSTSSSGIPSNLRLTIAGGPPPAKQNFRPIISLPVIGQNLRAHFFSVSQVKDQQSFKALISGDNELRSLEAADLNEKDIPSSLENPVENINAMVHDTGVDGKPSENASSADTVYSTAGNLCTSQDGSVPITSLSGQVVTGNGETPLNDVSLMDVAISGSQQQNPGADTISGKQGDDQEGQGILAEAESLHKNIDPSSLGKDLRQLSSSKAMEFDPIRQHRHFCPWIASNGNSLPGWKQTLNALERQKEFSSPLSAERPSSVIMVDDPVGSVRKLFTVTPLSSKRKKFTHGSN